METLLLQGEGKGNESQKNIVIALVLGITIVYDHTRWGSTISFDSTYDSSFGSLSIVFSSSNVRLRSFSLGSLSISFSVLKSELKLINHVNHSTS